MIGPEEDVSHFERAYFREKMARAEAERIIDEKSTEVFKMNQKLMEFNRSLEHQVEERTRLLKQEIDRAERLAKVKHSFMANMSHEIRTPMNAILGFSNLLLGLDLGEEERSYVEIINKSTRNLLAIINDVLDLSKIEEGKVEIEAIPFNVNDLTHEVIQLIRKGSQNQEVEVFSQIDHSYQEIISDPTRIRQILLNLMSNAVKFTEKGYVKLRVDIKEKNKHFYELILEVKDTGIGIDSSKTDVIFESFSQEDHSTTRHYGGSGLGLTITRQLVRLLDGEIRVKTAKGEGSVFTVAFPVKIAKEQIKPQETPEMMNFTILQGKKFLLVEDNEVNQFLVKRITKDWPISLDIANNGAEAVEMVKESAFDIILMDIQMPVMDGLEASEIIRNKLGLDTPIIALTANALESERAAYFKAGMSAYISKPFEPNTFFSVLRENLFSKPRREE